MYRMLDVSKRYAGSFVLDSVSSEYGQPGFSVLFGGTGSGKSTFIRLLAGVETPDSGTVLLGSQSISEILPIKRNLAYIPQDFALYPTLTVGENIAHPLKAAGVALAERTRRAARLAERLGIGNLLKRRPGDLSGGQKQRVGLARGLVKPANLYLLDDPLVGLDYKIREQLLDDLRNIQEESNASFLYATSNPLEALAVGGEVGVLAKGRLVDKGSVNAVFTKPKWLWTRINMGYPRTNVLELALARDQMDTVVLPGGGRIALRRDGPAGDGLSADGFVLLTVRPDQLRLGAARPGDIEVGTGAVVFAEDVGGSRVVSLDVGGHDLKSFVPYRVAVPEVGSRVAVTCEAKDILVYERAGGLVGGACGAGG